MLCVYQIWKGWSIINLLLLLKLSMQVWGLASLAPSCRHCREAENRGRPLSAVLSSDSLGTLLVLVSGNEDLAYSKC